MTIEYNVRDAPLFSEEIPKLNAVMVLHRPTGTVIQCDDTDSVDENRRRCFDRLLELIKGEL